MGDSSYVRDLQARWSTPSSVVDEIVRRAAHAAADEVERVIQGYQNEVYRVRAGARRLVVRIRHSGEGEFEQEAWAMRQARQAGVPVPDIVLLDAVRVEGEELSVMVLPELPGRPLSTLLSRLTARDVRDVLVQAGTTLARLNSVSVEGFGRPQAGQEWRQSTWHVESNARLDYLTTGTRGEITSAGFSVAEFDTMIRLVTRSFQEFTCDRPVLCHGDFTPEHLFVDEDLRICGLIDFGLWAGGPAVHDLAYLRYARPDLDLAAVIEGYGVLGNADATDRTRIELHSLGIAMAHLAHDVRTGDTAEARRSADSLAGLLRSLDQPPGRRQP